MLNLPTKITFNNNEAIENRYVYSATGQKLQVTKQNLSGVSITDYVGSNIYENGSLKRTLVAGGYVEDGQYYYFLTDHLGSTRVVASANGEAMQTNHYYPYGLTFAEGFDDTDQPYLYNGKEFDRNMGLNEYDYGARCMNPFFGRFTTIDPLSEIDPSVSPYAYCRNNPIKFIDPDGRMASTHTDMDGNVIAVRDDGDFGVYRHKGTTAEAEAEFDSQYSSTNTSAGGEYMGESLHSLSFADQKKYNRTGEINPGQIKIDFGSTELTDQVQAIVDANPSAVEYAGKARAAGPWDIKDHVKTGSLLYGKYASPRDAGNFAAGIVAGMHGALSPVINFGYGAYNMTGNSIGKTGALT